MIQTYETSDLHFGAYLLTRGVVYLGGKRLPSDQRTAFSFESIDNLKDLKQEYNNNSKIGISDYLSALNTLKKTLNGDF